ncbi:energy transducer TonB [Hymenobacter latericoloratus]
MTTSAHTSLPSLDDIVFEGRNKAYGAYVLRKAYGRHVITAIGMATALAALLIATPLLIQRFWPSETVTPEVPVDPLKPITLIDPVFATPKPAEPAATATVVVRPPSAPATRVVPDEQVQTVPDEQITAPVADGPVVVGDVPQEGNGGSLVATGPVGGSDSASKPAAPPVTKPFVHVENMPEFMGGSAALTKYLQRHLRYPSQALRAGVEGKVYISFTVNSDGSIMDVEVLKGLGYGTDEEASRVIRQMPAWKPGYQNQHAVPVRYTLPITFKYE